MHLNFTSTHAMKRFSKISTPISKTAKGISSTLGACKDSSLEGLMSPIFVLKEVRQANRNPASPDLMIGSREAFRTARTNYIQQRKEFLSSLPSKTGNRNKLYRACYNIAAVITLPVNAMMGMGRDTFVDMR